MKIEVNSEIKEVENQIVLLSLLDELMVNTTGIAVAINNTVVPKSNWSVTKLKENDKILLIKAAQGG